MSEKKYRVEKNEEFGRFLVADKDLEAGELIFEETPFVVGPKSDSPVLCLGCYGPCWGEAGPLACAACGWPVCSERCAQSPHHRPECEFFSRVGATFNAVDDPGATCMQLDCIAPLRMLLERTRQAERWSQLEALETHTEARRGTATWQADLNNVAGYLLQRCRLPDADEDRVMRVCGILEVNAIEVPARGCSASARVLYPQLALSAHNCVPNITHTIKGDFRMEVRAATALASGTPLLLCYVHTLTPTLQRREFLLASKFFHCSCDRCKDPTELDTHLSSLKCMKCDDGVIMSSNPLDNEARWKCSHCEFNTSADATRKMSAVLQAEIDELDLLEPGPQAIEMREQFIKKYRSALHPRHSHLVAVKLTLGQLYGRVAGYELDELPDLLLERKLELCRDALRVLDTVAPGLSRLRATVIYELHAPLMFLARSQFEAGLIGRDELKSRLAEPLECLRHAVRVLRWEDPESPEGQLGELASMSAEQLQASIDTL